MSFPAPALAVPGTTRSRVLLVAGVLLVAADLRPALTSVGPVLPALRADLGLSATAAGSLSALPLLAFAAASPLAPRLAHRLGVERCVVLALAVLAAGTVLRSVAGPVGLFTGTAVLAAGIGTANVLLPALVKSALPDRVGVVTSWYAATLTLAAALASGVAVPVAEASAGGWRTALGCWSVLAVVGALAWLPATRAGARRRAGAAAPAPVAHRTPWRSGLAWQVAAFMALQSLGFYSVVAWLPSVLVDRGASAASAGAQLLAFQLVGLVGGLAVPLLLRGRADQRAAATASAVLSGTGYLGLALAPGLTGLWTVAAGLGAGTSFTLALTLIALRSADAARAASLSTMAQAAGYLVAAAGPLAVGAVHDVTGAWTAPLLLLALTTVPEAFAGRGAGQDRVVP